MEILTQDLLKNVEVNNLDSQIHCYNKALGEAPGKLEFYTHKEEDSSGDGFKDTKRAGKTSKISVDSTTIDKWWEDSGKKNVDLVKIDIEGAELYAFKGGIKMIEQCHPIIISELNLMNIEVYPFEVQDYLNFVQSIGYGVYDIYTDDLLSNEEVFKLLKNKRDTYVLKHIENGN